MIRIIILESNLVTREGLVNIFSKQLDIEILGLTTNSAETLALTKETQPTLLILDLAIPFEDGSSLIPNIKEVSKDTRIIILSSVLDSAKRILELIELGISSYVQNNSSSEILLTAVRQTSIGNTYLTPSTALNTINRIYSKNSSIGMEFLDNLTLLNISKNQLADLPSEICQLKSLELLDLSDNKLTKLPAEIELLTRLRSLDVSNNQLTLLPLQIGNLKNLEELRVQNNPLGIISPAIYTLDNLKRLKLSGCSISEVSLAIFKLKNLIFLDLSKNWLLSLPNEFQELRALKVLDLRGNTLDIPPEILASLNNPSTIINAYFDRLKRQLLESKILFVGQGFVGKTSLVQQILHGTFDQNQAKTEGISINQWSVDSRQLLVESKNQESSADNHQPIKLNIWDFGGQEIMHATHQFFLTKRSLYLLVVNARQTQEENRIEYWLKIIQSFGGDSPILIVGNQTDEHPFDIDKTGLQKKYPNIVGILETSAKTGAGIETLKAEIAKQVDILPHVRDFLPMSWFTVKSKLEELSKSKNFFTQDEYLDLCETNNIQDEASRRTLISFLHDLGVVLHFQDDPRLEVLGILNPQWVTNGVYKILNSHELFQNQGNLTLPILNKILDFPEYPSTTKRLYIVDMMKKFELCYDIESDKSFLIPDLLPKDEPFTGEWNNSLAFQIHYNVLPSSIISRFIVRLNAFIYKTIWRSGVVLKREENTALVKADTEDKKIYIWVNGEESTRRDFLSAIRMEFDAIHRTIAKIEATEKIPIPNVPEATPVDYEFLLRLEKDGRESLPVQAGSQIVDLIVKEVLSRIETATRKTEIHIHGNVENSNLLVGDKNRADNTNTKNK